jgi:hypothetical protein
MNVGVQNRFLTVNCVVKYKRELAVQSIVRALVRRDEAAN